MEQGDHNNLKHCKQYERIDKTEAMDGKMIKQKCIRQSEKDHSNRKDSDQRDTL